MMLSMLENRALVKKDRDLTEFDYCCNVLCVGAGSAGCYAADSAAREGASVILLEIGENIGGMHVSGGVTGYYYGTHGGSYEEDDLKTDSDTVFLTNTRHWEQRQIRLTERLLKSGVKVLCRHSVLGLYLDGARVVGVLAFDGEKKFSIKADVTIDATSDGHLIRMTDVKKQYGRPSDGSFVPFSISLKYTKNGKLLSKHNDSGIMDHYCERDFSQKTVTARADAGSMLRDVEIVNCSLHTGIREGLTYEGEATLRYEELLLGKQSEKVLFWAYSDLDRHGGLRATEEELFQNWWVISNLSTVVIRIPIPFGSVVPQGIKGLVTAGRCLSCDTYTQSAVRMNRDMFRMGECVGVAAAMAALSCVDFLEIDYEEYLTRVRAFIEMCENEIGDAPLKIAIENVDSNPFTESQTAALKLFMKSEKFGLTLDTGHEHCLGYVDSQVFSRYSDKLIHMHLHDARGRSAHLPLGTGEVKIAEKLALLGDGTTCLVEVKTVAGLRESIKYLKCK